MNKYPYKHPIQDTYLDEHGVLRFTTNAIVEHLQKFASENGCDLNDLSRMDFSANDWRQFQQLHGYSVGGFSSLSVVSNPFGEEEYEDGYYEYIERQIPEYFMQDGLTEEDIGFPIVKSLLEQIKKQMELSKKQDKDIKEMMNKVVAEVEMLRKENEELKSVKNKLVPLNREKEWRDENGYFHRIDGPAIMFNDGGEQWRLHGKLHRTDGPAIKKADGTKYWFINGNQLSEEEFKFSNKMKIADCKEKNTLPEFGDLVRTEINPSESGNAFLVSSKHQNARKSSEGTYKGYVPGCGGDVWWVEHEDGSVGAYLTNEVFDR